MQYLTQDAQKIATFSFRSFSMTQAINLSMASDTEQKRTFEFQRQRENLVLHVVVEFESEDADDEREDGQGTDCEDSVETADIVETFRNENGAAVVELQGDLPGH